MIGYSYEEIAQSPTAIIAIVLACVILTKVASYLFEKLTHSKEKQGVAIVKQLQQLNEKLTELITDVRVLTHKSSDFEDDLKHVNYSLKQAKEQLHEHSKIIAIQTEKIKNLENRK